MIYVFIFARILGLLTLFSCLSDNMAVAQSLPDQSEAHFRQGAQQLGEFIRRFNSDRPAFRSKSIQGVPQGVHTGRAMSILYLLDRKGALRMGRPLVDRFLAKVADVQMPVYLDFHGIRWYAELECRGQAAGKEQSFYLTMANHCPNPTQPVSSWILVGARLPEYEQPEGSLPALPGLYGTLSLMPDEPINHLPILLEEVRSRQRSLRQVSHVRFIFAQVPDWLFIVEKRLRDTDNNGWLITSISFMPEAEKRTYLASLLKVEYPIMGVSKVP